MYFMSEVRDEVYALNDNQLPRFVCYVVPRSLSLNWGPRRGIYVAPTLTVAHSGATRFNQTFHSSFVLKHKVHFTLLILS